jgi:hypothetical protein
MLYRVCFSLLVVARGFPGPAGQSDAWEQMAAILVAGDTVVLELDGDLAAAGLDLWQWRIRSWSATHCTLRLQ